MVCIRSFGNINGVIPFLLLVLLYRCCIAWVLLKQRKWAGIVQLVMFNVARQIRIHRSQLSQKTQVEVRLLLYHGCHNVQTLRCFAGTQMPTADVRAKKTKRKKGKCNSLVVGLSVFLGPILYFRRALQHDGTHAHACSHASTQKHRSVLLQGGKIEAWLLYRDCPAFEVWRGTVLQKQQQRWKNENTTVVGFPWTRLALARRRIIP